MVTQTEITEDIFNEYLEMGFNPFGSGPVPVFVKPASKTAHDATDLYADEESPLGQNRDEGE